MPRTPLAGRPNVFIEEAPVLEQDVADAEGLTFETSIIRRIEQEIEIPASTEQPTEEIQAPPLATGLGYVEDISRYSIGSIWNSNAIDWGHTRIVPTPVDPSQQPLPPPPNRGYTLTRRDDAEQAEVPFGAIRVGYSMEPDVVHEMPPLGGWTIQNHPFKKGDKIVPNRRRIEGYNFVMGKKYEVVDVSRNAVTLYIVDEQYNSNDKFRVRVSAEYFKMADKDPELNLPEWF